MNRYLILPLLLILITAGTSRAQISPDTAQKLSERIAPSLVAVQYTVDTEIGRQELRGAGVVVREDGLVVTSIGLFDQRIPDEQMKDFKIILPRLDEDPQEIDATFQGRDERTNLAFLKPKESAEQKWAPVKFEDVPVSVGEPLISIGILPKEAGYRPYLTQASVAAILRGETPHVLVSGDLGGIGSPVFNADGRAIGFVNVQPGQSVFLNDPRMPLGSALNPPKFFIPTRDFSLSLAKPPTADDPIRIPWIGVPQSAMSGLNPDVAEELDLKNQPAIEVGDVIKDSPAAKAGLKQGDIVVKLNGQPLERGDTADELPDILVRTIRRMSVGDRVALSIFTSKDQPPREVEVTLEERPKMANLAARYWNEDLGFAVREIVFADTYIRRLPADTQGVIVALVKPQSSANSAQLEGNDLITDLNGQPVQNVEQFKEDLEAFRKEKVREAVVLVVRRDSSTQVIRIEPPQ